MRGKFCVGVGRIEKILDFLKRNGVRRKYELKAAIAILDDEIQDDKEERKVAKSQLEKAILEGKPVSPFEKLLESASVV